MISDIPVPIFCTLLELIARHVDSVNALRESDNHINVTQPSFKMLEIPFFQFFRLCFPFAISCFVIIQSTVSKLGPKTALVMNLQMIAKLGISNS